MPLTSRKRSSGGLSNENHTSPRGRVTPSQPLSGPWTATPEAYAQAATLSLKAALRAYREASRAEDRAWRDYLRTGYDFDARALHRASLALIRAADRAAVAIEEAEALGVDIYALM